MDFGFTLNSNSPRNLTLRAVLNGPPVFVLSLVLSLAIALLGVAPAMGQDKTQKTAGADTTPVPGLTVTCNPEGALVELTGVASLAGLSPVYFSQGIPGIYELKVSKTGYETYRRKVQISVDRVEQVDVRLDPKTRGKAAIRSLIWPGWGQSYAGQKGKGTFMRIVAVAAGATAVLAELSYQNKKDDFDVANASYQNALQNGSVEGLTVWRSRLEVAQTDAHDAESFRRAAVGGAIAVWAVSFLDALFFFPSADGQIAVKNISITPEGDFKAGYAGIKASFSF